jgi:hypothetical protein
MMAGMGGEQRERGGWGMADCLKQADMREGKGLGT